MTVFKTFLKVVKANKGILILYTALLAIFGSLNMQTTENNLSFTSEKPNILIIDNDSSNISKSLSKYLGDKCNIVDIENDLEKISDALFYREISYLVVIPKDFSNDFMNKKDVLVDIKKTSNASSSVAEMLVNKYLNILKTYREVYDDENLIISKTEDSLKKDVNVNISSSLDTDKIANMTYYFNFLNYSMLASALYIIGVVISSFREEKIKKRTEISSTKYTKINRDLLLSNSLFVVCVWFIYLVIGYLLVGNILFSMHGLMFAINSFIFSMCALTVGFLIANITSNKNAISGIVNVVALGTSFLCGMFVPMELLPKSVLTVAHVLPSYWYIKSNELLKTIEVINFENLKEVYMNMIIILVFSLGFIILTNIISNKKRKIN